MLMNLYPSLSLPLSLYPTVPSGSWTWCLRCTVRGFSVGIAAHGCRPAVNLTTRGLNGLVDDILALLPQDEIILLFFDKLETSNDFSYFFEQVGSGEFENVLNMLQVRTKSERNQGLVSWNWFSGQSFWVSITLVLTFSLFFFYLCLQSSQQLRILLWRLQRHGFDIPGWIQQIQRYFSFSSFWLPVRGNKIISKAMHWHLLIFEKSFWIWTKNFYYS